MRKSPKAPQEDPSVARMRERQIVDLAKADEEANLRIKAGLMSQRGVRAFRRSTQAKSASAKPVAGRAWTPDPEPYWSHDAFR